MEVTQERLNYRKMLRASSNTELMERAQNVRQSAITICEMTKAGEVVPPDAIIGNLENHMDIAHELAQRVDEYGTSLDRLRADHNRQRTVIAAANSKLDDLRTVMDCDYLSRILANGG